MPFRVFAAGEVLTAANVNDYLAEQAISTFAGTAARASAITAPTEGQFAYLSDSDSLTFYNGSAWVNAGSAIAGTALSSGTATSGQVLTANGSGGVSFAYPGLVLLNTTSFSAVASQSINDVFSANYDNYRINITATFTADVAIRLRFRVSGADNTTANYYDQYLYQENTTLAAGRDNAQTSHKLNANTASGYVKNEIIVFDPFSSSTETNMFVKNMNRRNAQNSNTMTTFFAANTSFTGFTFFPDSGNMTGSIQVYGFNK